MLKRLGPHKLSSYGKHQAKFGGKMGAPCGEAVLGLCLQNLCSFHYAILCQRERGLQDKDGKGGVLFYIPFI